MAAPITIGYFNPIGTGWGKMTSRINAYTVSRHSALFEDNKMQVECKNGSDKNKYKNIIEKTQYYIIYQAKIATKCPGNIAGMTLNGIFEKTDGIVREVPWENDEDEGILLEFNVRRVDKEEPFSMKVYNNGRATHKWGDSIPPESWEGSKHVAFRGSVGSIKDTNFRHKFITDFMRDNNYI